MDKLVENLKEFGFNTYESKVYIALLKKFPATGYEVSKLANVPQSRTYDTLKTLLEKNNLSPQEIQGVVVGIGPGSYTGIRIALTTAKILSLSLNIPIYPVSSLRLLKEEDKPTICLMNARSGRSYFAVYEGDKTIVEDQTMTNDKVKEYIQNHFDYIVKGELGYLEMNDNVGNITREAFSLFPYLEKVNKPLAIKPVYMKG